MTNFYNLFKLLENHTIIKESVQDIMDMGYNLANMSVDEIEKMMKRGEKVHYYYPARDSFVSKFGWSIPCKEAIEAIKKYAREPLYDAMAGTGFWAKILNLNGIKTIAYDLHSNLNKNHYHSEVLYTNRISPTKHLKVKRKNALRLGHDLGKGRIKGDLFLSWPPYRCSAASELLSMLKIGTRVFYIGEGYGGCTGDASFHVNLDNNFKLLERVFLPQFPGIHDSMYIYEKIKNDPVEHKYRGKDSVWEDQD